ncbi:MAG: RnfABCDGE type electron transport complex subunit D [Clostridia bacterium]|nr:RnfABCDGE type electron transport complex subunit D [Oscillospiraceae bacterium]MBQ2746314.1 RnfABCDGE type electron transport complex subunit D [Clostridia bacterium]
MRNNLTVSSSPHIHSGVTSQSIMLDVIIALLPAAVYGVFIFGWRAAVLIAVCVASAVLSEFLWNKALKKPNSLGDLTAVVTGLLLALNLPSSLPVWMAALGSAIAIIVVKQMFGGLGHNFANPAITARIVLMVSFPAAMTKFFEPFSMTVSSATPLAGGAEYTLRELFFGMHAGTIGETSVVMLVIGGLYLVMRRVISPIIPVSFIGTVFVFSWVLGANPIQAIFSGGLLLGAIFMATDYVTSPTFNWGKLIFGIGCGIITVVIRQFASLPEGVSYSILVMNLLVPHINSLTMPKPFGWEADKK